MKVKTLLIISHTEHYLDAQGNPYGWTSTVKEIDYLASRFKKIIHLAVLHKNEVPPKSTAQYSSENVQFISIPAYGGPGIWNKLKILVVIPLLFTKVAVHLRKADLFQFRAPTSIGIFLIPFLSLFFWKKGWYKYAGNWMQPNMPRSYKIQKWLLEKIQNRPVTINGQWPNQNSHCFTFENPCLFEADLDKFKEETILKPFNLPLQICFVGRLEPAKGVDRIVELLLSSGIEEKIATMHFIGDGDRKQQYETILLKSNVTVVFHGFLERDAVFNIYKQCDGFFLPSDSEGFPKVIAEAAAFGCIPFVSDVSSIGQYVNGINGFLWQVDKDNFTGFFQSLFLGKSALKNKQLKLYQLAEKFTFERYFNMLIHQKIIE